MNEFKEFKETVIPKGQIVQFVALNIKEDLENPGRTIYPLMFLSPRDSIFFNNKIEEIGVVIGGTKENPIYDTIVFKPESDGKITLNSGNPIDEKRYAYLTFSNYNESNPHRNKDVTPLFRLLDVQKEEEELFDLAELEDSTIALVYTLSKKQLQAVSAVLDFNTAGLSDKAIMMNLRGLAKTQSKVLNDAINKIGKKEGEQPVDDNLKKLNQAFLKRRIKNDKEAKEVWFDSIKVFTYTSEELDKQELLDSLTNDGTIKDVLDF